MSLKQRQTHVLEAFRR